MRLDEQGFITVVDRIKDVINTGGVLVASREVEDALYTHPAVAEVAVIGTPDDRWIEAVTAFVVLRDDQDASGFDTGELITHAKGRLARYKVPEVGAPHRGAAPQPVGQAPQARPAREGLSRA